VRQKHLSLEKDDPPDQIVKLHTYLHKNWINLTRSLEDGGGVGCSARLYARSSGLSLISPIRRKLRG
jgi:hypothetical protein